MVMRGQISQGMGEPWCVHGCSGMAATVGPSSRRRGSPTRTATAALPTGRCWRPPASRTLKRWRPSGTTRGALAQFLFKGRYVMTARAAVARQSHDHQFGEVLERDRHDTVFGEVAVRGTAGRQTWVAGLAIERDAYTARDVPRFDYTFTVPGAFAQYDVTASPNLSLSASARLDVHSEYGTFFSPRVSALAHAGRWTSRLSVGTGFFGPTPITEETEAAGLTRLEVRQPIEAERGLSASFDVSRTDGPLSYTATLFASRISDPLHVERSPSYVLSTLPDPTTNVGLELLGTLRREPFSVTATYTYVRARETVDAVEQDVPLTPRHSAGVVGMWEAGGRRTGRNRVVLHRAPEPRRESVPSRQRAIHDSRPPGGKAVRTRSAVRERREPDRSAGRRAGIRSFYRLVRLTVDGPSMRGRRSKAATSTAASASGSESLSTQSKYLEPVTETLMDSPSEHVPGRIGEISGRLHRK